MAAIYKRHSCVTTRFTCKCGCDWFNHIVEGNEEKHIPWQGRCAWCGIEYEWGGPQDDNVYDFVPAKGEPIAKEG